MNRNKRTSPKPQTTLTTREPFANVAGRLADTLADTIEHPDCCEYLRERIAELHSGLMTEFQCDVADDIRLRFALGAVKAAEGDRPA